MNNLKISVFKGARVVLALSIAVANLGLFAMSSSAAPRSCIGCYEYEGGALGRYVVCEANDEGPMSTCTPGLNECYGYPCVWGEAAPEAEIEVIPTQFTAPAN